ncbi:hypothetical protein BC628DRAFT_147817 [Trametes gibbosa]|nr:hypothetical protein BC628DRAFT_147817 [Trametes gibbosa]
MPSPPSSSTERPIKRRRGRAKEDPDYIPRPLNAFLIFRQEFCQTYALNDATGKRVAQSIISKEAGISWKSMPYEMKKSWFLRANVAKQEHATLQQPYLDNAEAARGLSSTQAATSTDFDLFSAFWSPPFEALGMPSSTTPTRGVICDPSVFDPQSFTVSQETVQIPASAQQMRIKTNG